VPSSSAFRATFKNTHVKEVSKQMTSRKRLSPKIGTASKEKQRKQNH